MEPFFREFEFPGHSRNNLVPEPPRPRTAALRLLINQAVVQYNDIDLDTDDEIDAIVALPKPKPEPLSIDLTNDIQPVVTLDDSIIEIDSPALFQEEHCEPLVHFDFVQFTEDMMEMHNNPVLPMNQGGPQAEPLFDPLGDSHELQPGGSAVGNSVIDVDQFEIQKATEKFNLLKEMFPDADTDFLESRCSEHAFNSNEFQLFVENVMIAGDYPKKEMVPDEDLVEQNNNEVVEDAFENKPFELHSFLKKYPDPVTHFSGNLNGPAYVKHSCNFLQMRYRYVSAVDVRLILRASDFNMYVAHKKFQGFKGTRKIPRRQSEVKAIPTKPPKEFLETVVFIENEDEVIRYLEDQYCARLHAVQEARRAKALLTCGCCFSDDLLAVDVSHCSEGHIFCKKCVIKSVEVNIGDGKLDFRCLQECTASFEINILKEIIPTVVFEKIEKKLQEKEVAAAGIPGLESCPFCEYCAIPPEEARVFECENCKKKSCRLCRKVSHVPLKCSEVEDTLTQNRVFVEERMTEALLRKCHRCGAKFIREDGCNKMTCVCGAVMCYICRKSITSYNHFYEGTRRCNCENKCPLWTNNTNLHKMEVNRERDRAIEDVKRKNPHMDTGMFKKLKE